MEATKRILFTIVFIALLLVRSTEAHYIVKNESSKDIVLIAVVDVNVNILIKVGDVVEIPAKHHDWYVKNRGNGAQSQPIHLDDGSVIIVVDGIIKGTVKLLLGVFLDGVLSILANANVLVEI